MELTEAKKLHEIGLTGEGVTVSILDSGISDKLLDELRGRGIKVCLMNRNYEDKIGHGTVVTEIFATVCPKVKTLYIGKVVNPDGRISDGKAMDMLEKVRKLGADVVNISFGSVKSDDGTHPLAREVNYLFSKGVLPVCAAGNGYGRGVSYPASAKDAIAVGAVNIEGKPAAFNSYSVLESGIIKPDVMAYGVNIESKRYDGCWRVGRAEKDKCITSGTSFAVPQVSGGLALLLQAWKGDKRTVREALYETAEKYQSGKVIVSNFLSALLGKYFLRMLMDEPRISKETMGHGIIRLARAYRYLERLK